MLLGAAFLASGFFALKTAMSKAAEKHLEEAILRLPPEIGMRFKGVSVDVLGQNVYIKDVTLSFPGESGPQEAFIKEIVVYDMDRAHRFPRHGDVLIEGVRLDVQALASSKEEKARELASFLHSLGYDGPLQLRSRGSWKYAEKDAALEAKAVIGAKEMGKAMAEFRLTDLEAMQKVPWEWFFGQGKKEEKSMAGLAAMAAMSTTSLSLARLAYEDDSLAQRFFDLAEEEARQEGRNFKEEAQDSLKQEIDRAKTEGNPFSRQAFEALLDFVDHPKKIEISASPKKPVSLMQIAQKAVASRKNPEAIIKLLGLELQSSH